MADLAQQQSLLPPWTLLQALSQHSIQPLCLLAFASEGNNAPDAMRVADAVNKYLRWWSHKLPSLMLSVRWQMACQPCKSHGCLLPHHGIVWVCSSSSVLALWVLCYDHSVHKWLGSFGSDFDLLITSHAGLVRCLEGSEEWLLHSLSELCCPAKATAALLRCSSAQQLD